MDGRDLRIASWILHLGITLALILMAGYAGVPTQKASTIASPPDSLVTIAVTSLMTDNKTQEICVLISDGNEIKNISENLYQTLKRRHPGFCSCGDTRALYVVGPLKLSDDKNGTLEISTASSGSPCLYQVTKRGENWRLRKQPCYSY
jgi:hypothetical protein